MRRYLLALAAVLSPAAALAQTPAAPAVAASRACMVVPDTARGLPTPGQIADRLRLRDQIDSVARRHGITPARGILFVDVDSTRRGKLLFLDTNLEGPAVSEATRLMEAYLHTLPPGRGYQALVRIDGDYAALAPGKRHCLPELDNPGELSDLMQGVLERHPESGKRTRVDARRARLRLVVNRDGGVSFVDVDEPTGDPFLDQHVESIARKLRFRPASLEGVPYDVRYRFTMTFNVR